MAAGRKEYELLMKLTAALGSNFNSTFQTAMNTTKRLQDSLTSIKKVQNDISAYKKTQDAVETQKASIQDLTKKHGDLQAKLQQTVTREQELQKALEKSAKSTGTDTDEYKKLEAELKKTQTEKEKLTGQVNNTAAAIDKANGKIAEEERKLDDLSKSLKEAGVNTNSLTQENDKLQKAYDRVKKSQEDIAKVNQKLDKNAAAISQTRTELTKTIGVMTAGAAAFYGGAIKPAMEFESAIAGVKKTVDGTPEQLLEIQNGIRKMATVIPLGTTEISAIAESAGQLGIETKSILGFTRTMADLGVTTNLAGEEAASTLAKFANITGMSQSNFDRLGSTIVALGNNLATTESDIAAMSLRLAGAGRQVGLSEAQILSYAGALSSVGIEAEAGGSAFSKVMNNMQLAVETGNKDLINFAKVAGVSAADFKNAFQKDAAGAINMFIKGLGNSKDKGESAIKVLDDMGITEVRMRDALLRAAGASDVFTQSLELGTQAWEENNALANEAQQRYATSESALQIMKNAFNDIGISLGSVFLPQLAEVFKKISELAIKFSEFAQNNPQLIKTLMGVVGGLGAVKVGTLASKLGFLEMEKGVLKTVKGLLGFKGKLAETAAEAATGGGKIASMGKSLTGYFSGVKNSIGNVGGSIDKLAGGKLSGLFSKVGGGISNGILKPLGGIGSKVTGALGGVGGKITGLFGGIGDKIAAGPLGKIGGVFGSLGKSAGAVLGGPLKGLGSLFGGLFGKAMPIVMIISALSILFMKLSGEDISGFIEPLREAFEQMKPVLAAAMEQFKELGKQLLPLLLDAAKQLAPILGQIITAILPVVLQLIQNIVPLIIQLVQQLLPVILNIITTLVPLLAEIITAVLPIVVQLLQTLLPIITQLVTAVLPIIVDVLNMLMPIITELIQAVLPVLMTILQALMPVIQVLADLFGKVLGAAIEGLKPIINALMTILKGIIDFVVGVFTGDWGKAWEGVKNIFKGIVDGLVGIFKFPINLIIEGINFFLSGLNKLKIPDWVPGVGGKGINIPLIPKLEKGSNFTPDTFIAGDVNGKGGELITNARGRKVFTAAQTNAIFDNINKAKAINSATDAAPKMPTIAERVGGFIGALTNTAQARNTEATAQGIQPLQTRGTGGGEPTFVYSPTINTGGKTTENVEEIKQLLKEHGEEMLQKFKEFLRQQRENERRMGYA